MIASTSGFNSISRIVGRSGNTSNERCVSVREALELSGPHDTIPTSLLPLQPTSDANPTFAEYLEAYVRIGDESITVSRSTCTSGPEHASEIAAVVVSCPTDVADRCAGCILNLANGEAIHQSMKLNVINIAF